MKKYFYSVFLAGVTALTLSAAEDDTSTLSNAAQAQKAENLAQASEAAAQKEAESAQMDLEKAQSEYDSALSALEADPENLDLQEAFSLAEQNLNDAATALSSISGVSVESINEMRASGMGWGEIAHELGVHPSVLGLGAKNRAENQERVRDTKSFKSSNTASSNDTRGWQENPKKRNQKIKAATHLQKETHRGKVIPAEKGEGKSDPPFILNICCKNQGKGCRFWYSPW